MIDKSTTQRKIDIVYGGVSSGKTMRNTANSISDGVDKAVLVPNPIGTGAWYKKFKESL